MAQPARPYRVRRARQEMKKDKEKRNETFTKDTHFGTIRSGPIFVARQLVKHQVGLVWNEISRRYVDFPPTFYIPESWRGRATDKKQGSSSKVVNNQWTKTYESACHQAVLHYNQLIDSEVSPEQARLILPQSMMTEWYWSGTLFAFARVCNLRCKPDAQYETQQVTDQIDNLARQVAPVSWQELRD